MNNYVIATIKSWNIKNAEGLKRKNPNIFIINDEDGLNAQHLDRIGPRYVFFPHWSRKIPKEIYEKYECVVFHMTDLPFGRGGSPLQNLIQRGVRDTKISAIKVIEEMDAGPIYMKEDLEMSGSAEQIYERASNIIFSKMIPYIIKNEPRPAEQKGEVVVFKRRKPEDSDISGLKDVEKIYDHIRMLDAEGYPKAFLDNDGITFEFCDAAFKDGKLSAKVNIRPKKI